MVEHRSAEWWDSWVDMGLFFDERKENYWSPNHSALMGLMSRMWHGHQPKQVKSESCPYQQQSNRSSSSTKLRWKHWGSMTHIDWSCTPRTRRNIYDDLIGRLWKQSLQRRDQASAPLRSTALFPFPCLSDEQLSRRFGADCWLQHSDASQNLRKTNRKGSNFQLGKA